MHEIFGRVLCWRIAVVFGQPPLTGVSRYLEAERAALGANDETALVKDVEPILHAALANVQGGGTLSYGIRNPTVVTAVVAFGHFEVERPRSHP